MMTLLHGKHTFTSFFLIASLAACLSACSRPTGDFGRALPGTVHDDLVPKSGKKFDFLRKETLLRKGKETFLREGEAAHFSRTDEELKLANLVWTIVRPLHTKDWISEALIEGRRIRFFPDINKKLDHRAYLFWLKLEHFKSSETRWNRIITDIRADQAAIAPFYEQARRVYVIDGQRLEFLDANDDLGLKFRQKTLARIEENEDLIELALNSLQFRYDAYDYAIKHLTLESPSARVGHAEAELARYGELIERGGERGLPFIQDKDLLYSRVKSEKNYTNDDALILK